MALQHLRSSTAHKRPIPTVMSAGQIAINTNETSPGLFFKDSNGDLVKVGPVHIGTTAPNSSPASVAATALVTGTVYQILTVGTSDFTLVGASANTVGTIFTATGTTTGTGTVSGQQGVEKGEQWLDTTGGTYVLKIYDGTAWRSESGTFVDVNGDTMTGDLVMNNANIVFEGATADDFETTLTVTDPTADRTITLPNVTGTVVTTGDTGTVTSTMISDGTIVNADVNASAAIAGTKIDPDFGSQTIETTGVFSAAAGAAATPSITFTSDTNTGIYRPGADQLAISTNGTQRIHIDNLGNVGIGSSITGTTPLEVTANTAELLRIHRNTSPAGSAELTFYGGLVGGAVATSKISSSFTSINDTSREGELIFSTLGSSLDERMRIDSSGNVGIGIGSPSSLLDVNGSAKFAGAISVDGGVSNENSSYGPGYLIQNRSLGARNLWTGQLNGSTTSTILADGSATFDGSVGIGTTTPAHKLHISGTGTINSRTIATDTGGDAAFFVQNNNSGIAGPLIYGTTKAAYGALDSGETAFYSNTNTTIMADGSSSRVIKFASGGNLEKMRLDGSGRLLVGTSSYSGNSAFVIKGGAAQNVGLVDIRYGSTRPTGADIQVSEVRFGSTDLTSNTAYAKIQCFTDGASTSDGDIPGRLVFSTTQDGYSNPNEAMQINRHGQLLVTSGGSPAFTGTNARIYAKSSATLIVAEGTSAGYTEGAFLTVAPSLARGGGIYMFNSNSGGTNSEWYAGRPYSAADYYVIARATSVSTPGSTTAQISNALFEISNSGNAILQGTLTQSGSDDRLKTNRTALTSALTKVESLEGFTFNWNQDAIDNYGFSADDGTLVGMSAQELQLVLPEAVKTVTHTTSVDDPTSGNSGEEDTYLTIQYERVVPLLVEAIKELSAQKSSLEARVAALEAS